MMRVVKPAAVSIEDALRNLVGRLTGCSPGDLPRTQEGLVQFLAENLPENLPNMEELTEAITQEVLARLDAPDGSAQDGEESKTKKKGGKAAE